MNHFIRGRGNNYSGDQVYFPGHASPGIYSRAFLEGRLTEKNLENFRRELAPGGGLSSYPHPWLMPEFWEFPTVSMGLGPIMAIYQARFNKYLQDRGIKDTSQQHVWCFIGDGETDEPETLATLQREHPGRILLSFPPQLAFGTGEHPTTAGCLRFLADFAAQRAGDEWSAIDLGCGSGILAIAAATLGATRVVAVENDGMALGYAIENAVRHGVADKIEFIEGDAIALMAEEGGPAYDLIAANLFRDLLAVLFPLFPDRLAPGGGVIVSGFLATQAELVSRHAEEAGLPLAGFLKRGKWMAARSMAENRSSQK